MKPKLSILLAVNDALTSEEWQRISPLGENPNRVGPQRVTPAACAKMVAAFNAQAQAKSGKWRGLPIYVGHPDFDPRTWPDQSRLGSVMALESRADGLWRKSSSSLMATS